MRVNLRRSARDPQAGDWDAVGLDGYTTAAGDTAYYVGSRLGPRSDSAATSVLLDNRDAIRDGGRERGAVGRDRDTSVGRGAPPCRDGPRRCEAMRAASSPVFRARDILAALHLSFTLAALAESLADLRKAQDRRLRVRAVRHAAGQLRRYRPLAGGRSGRLPRVERGTGIFRAGYARR
jgi:hypothetical protein